MKPNNLVNQNELDICTVQLAQKFKDTDSRLQTHLICFSICDSHRVLVLTSLNTRRIKSWFPQTWVSHTLSQHLSSKFAPNCCLQKMNQSINVHCMSHCCKLMWKLQRNFFERSSDVFRKVWIPICCVMCMPGDRSSNSSWNLSIVEVCGPFVYTHFFHTTDYHTFVDSLKLIRFTLCKRLQILFTRPG